MHWKMPGWTEEFIKARSERLFKEHAQKLITRLSLSPDDLAALAQTDTPLATILELEQLQLPPLTIARDHPGVQHLLGLSNDRILALLQEAIPSHGRVLKRFPQYSAKLTAEIKELILG